MPMTARQAVRIACATITYMVMVMRKATPHVKVPTPQANTSDVKTDIKRKS